MRRKCRYGTYGAGPPGGHELGEVDGVLCRAYWYQIASFFPEQPACKQKLIRCDNHIIRGSP